MVVKALKDAILSGRYGRGALLPSARDLSGELRVNKNTVTKAYRQLQLEGLVRVAPGRRPSVATVPGRPRRSPDDLLGAQIRSALSPILREARLLGVPVGRVQEMVASHIASFEVRTARRVYLFECNRLEAQQFARDVAEWVGVAVDWKLLDDLPGIRPRPSDVYVVPYYHLDDVAARLPARQIAGIHVAPDPGVLFELIEAAQKGPVVLVSGSARSAERFRSLFQYYTSRGIEIAHQGDVPGMKAALAASETVFATPVALASVERLLRRRPIEFPERIDPQSLHALRVLLSQGGETAAAGVPPETGAAGRHGPGRRPRRVRGGP